MPTFAYSARGTNGKTVQASLEAATRRDALRMITSRGLTPINISEAGEAAATAAKAKAAAAPRRTVKAAAASATAAAASAGGVKLNRSHRLAFLIALQELLSSGLSAGEAIRLLAARVKDPAIKALSAALWERIGEGATLSRAMATVPEVFEESTLNLIQAGEATGNLGDVVDRLIAHLTQQRELQRELVTSMLYPAFLSFVAGGVVLFFLFFLLPRLEDLFKALKGDLPTSTKILIGFSNFALHWGWLLVGLVVVGISMFWGWRKTEDGRKTTDRWLLQLPLIGPFVMAQTVLAFSQTFSVLLENGITAADALRMTERQISNRVHREAFNIATDNVLEGESMSKALTRTGCFPDLVLDQIAIGENTGNIVPSLRRVATNFQKVVSNKLNIFTKVIGNGVLMMVFIFVGFLAFAIVQAVFQLSNSIKQ